MSPGNAPEEKLLRMIRGDRQKTVKAASVPVTAAQAVTQNVKAARPEQGLRFRVWSCLSGMKAKRAILSAAFMLALCFFIATLAYSLFGLRNVPMPSVNTVKGMTSNAAAVASTRIKPLESYLQSVGAHSLFSAQMSSQSVAAAANVNINLSEEINLVGIIMGDAPQAVIEDKKNQKTYYVNKGQFVGDKQIDDIQSGKVIIQYNGQRYELFL